MANNVRALLMLSEQRGSNPALSPLGWGLLWCTAILLLLPSLSFPLGPDNGLFFVAGEKIIHQGAVHYRDIVDVKPPMIYYLNAVAIAIFGDNPISIRILDIFLQLLTCFFLAQLIRRASGSEVWGATALLLYPILYLGLNFANTAQVESFLGLLTLPAISLFLFRRTGWGFFGIGMLCGVATLFKFTFGITLAGFFLADLLLYSGSWKDRFGRYTMMGIGFGTIVALFFLYLFAFNAWSGFLQMQEFLSGYTGIQFGSKGDLIREMLTELPHLLSDEYSLTMLIGTMVAIGIGFSRKDRGMREEMASEDSDQSQLLLRTSTILFLLLLFTIAVEAKWLHYHLSRLFFVGAILGSFGLLQIGRRLFSKPRDKFRWVGFGLAFVLLLGFSPLTRYVFHLRPAVLLLAKGPEAFDAYYAHTRSEDDWTMEDLQKIGAFISAQRQPNDKLFISSGVAGLLYLECNYVPDFPIFHSGFLIAPFSPKAWIDSTISYLTETKPRFIILQRSDRMAIITGTNETSTELFNRIPETARLLEENYHVVMERPGFWVYKRE
ncbi:MAG: glycosyltransferase family 39 protein [Ignavibacteriae bacterium]|nr:glycosyltransferase family 39 protein [Ignavibacteriota bacterium]MCB9215535.1 glycosyltransferase family 39 protein [Ignavibacteria bacterium]